jgi:hypothetical protein
MDLYTMRLVPSDTRCNLGICGDISGECRVNPQSKKQKTTIETKFITIDLNSSDNDVTTINKTKVHYKKLLTFLNNSELGNIKYI